MRFEQPKTYDTFVNDKKALGINTQANELKRSMTNYFTNPDDQYDYRIREANADNNAEMVDAINNIRAQFDAQVPLTQKVFGDQAEVKQKGEAALKQISAELKKQGKGSLVNADGNVLFKNKTGELVDLDQGILKDLWHSTKANKGSIMAGVGGALLAPVTGGGSLLSVMVGGATGSALGAAGDYIGNADKTGQEVDAGTLTNLALENAGLSVLGDGIGYAVAKGGKALINKAGKLGEDVFKKGQTIKDSLGNEIENVNLKQKAVNILNNTPLLGDVTSANHAPAMGDITRSIKAADAVLSPEELAEKEAYLANNKIELNDINTLGLKAKAYADDYANRTSSPWVKDKVTKAGEYVENKAKGTLDPQITKEQEIALNNAFADPSEMKTIADVIGGDDLVRNQAIKIIDDQAQKRLEAAGIDKNFRINPESFRKLDDTDKAFVSDILGSYVNATKSDYNQVVGAFKQVAGDSPLQIDKKGLDDAINSIVANYAKVEDRDKMRIALEQMAQEGFNINKAFDVRRYLNKAIRNSDYTGEQQARALKEVLDDSMFKSLGDDRGELRALLKEQDDKYAQMKALKDTRIFNKNNDLLNDDFSFSKMGELINKNNDVWAKATKGLNKEQISEIEKAYIRNTIKDELTDLGMNRKGFNPIAVAEKLSNAKFVSDEAKTLQKALFDDAKFRPNTKGIIDAIDAGLKTKSQGGSIATSFSGKVAMAFVARSFERLVKHIPLIGKQAGKKNLYAEAFLKAKTTSDALTDIMKNEAIPIKDRFDLLTQAQSKEIRSLIDDFMAKKEQAKSDLIKMDNGAYSGHPMLRPDEPSIEQGDLKGNLIDKEAIWGGDALSDLNSPRTAKRGSEADATIIPQKGNLINETTKQEDISSLRAKIEQENNIVPIKEFGTNYAEFYHDGKGAIDKLLTEREGQVAGAFYRKELGDITLPWGEVSQSGNKIKGYGLAKIIKKHGVEILNELPNVFKTGALIKQNDVHYRIESGNYVVGLSAEFKGKKHNFVLTAFERVGRETDTFTDPSFKVASDNLATNSNKNIISQKGNLINKRAKNSALPNGDDESKAGFVTKEELLNLGENVRNFIKEHKKPFVNKKNARIYEWEDKDGVRFRLVINDIKDKNGGSGIHSAITSTSANDDIITFYSDRNLKEPMKFENPKLKLLDAIDNSSDKVGAVEKILLNKHISDGVKAKAVNRLTKNKISQGEKISHISTKNSNNN